jgi:hypothetical protein
MVTNLNAMYCPDSAYTYAADTRCFLKMWRCTPDSPSSHPHPSRTCTRSDATDICTPKDLENVETVVRVYGDKPICYVLSRLCVYVCCRYAVFLVNVALHPHSSPSHAHPSLTCNRSGVTDLCTPEDLENVVNVVRVYGHKPKCYVLSRLCVYVCCRMLPIPGCTPPCRPAYHFALFTCMQMGCILCCKCKIGCTLQMENVNAQCTVPGKRPIRIC